MSHLLLLLLLVLLPGGAWPASLAARWHPGRPADQALPRLPPAAAPLAPTPRPAPAPALPARPAPSTSSPPRARAPPPPPAALLRAPATRSRPPAPRAATRTPPARPPASSAPSTPTRRSPARPSARPAARPAPCWARPASSGPVASRASPAASPRAAAASCSSKRLVVLVFSHLLPLPLRLCPSFLLPSLCSFSCLEPSPIRTQETASTAAFCSPHSSRPSLALATAAPRLPSPSRHATHSAVTSSSPGLPVVPFTHCAMLF